MATQACRTDLSGCIEDLRSEMEVLREAQDRLCNVARLQAILGVHGLEIFGYDGPARYELGRIVQCELCGDLVTVEDISYELRLRSKVWGPRFGYVHKECFQQATRME